MKIYYNINSGKTLYLLCLLNTQTKCASSFREHIQPRSSFFIYNHRKLQNTTKLQAISLNKTI